ncbi:DUF368 domain-containing protein [Halobacillus sp. A5]|uniref:DUF368 domain-containing protein n=1 Tax=Halobacillus sp. A5 TaxID=2880263 RepID=UPI0020A636E6|nr:DUF368 domain-containing protein [Halobacillus sp. A5]MCP3027063.1 DUF368 domain-containing protein [Halobacillus sp. A5]
MYVLLRGMAVGVTESVPGVSGSTVAIILGIYNRLLYSLSLLTTPRRKEALPFLIVFGIGMLCGFGVSIYVVDYFLHYFQAPTLMFFAGVVLGFLPVLWKETIGHTNSKLKFEHWAILVFFCLIVIFSQFLVDVKILDVEQLSIATYTFLIGAGFLASSALVLRGMSGALILTILGTYEVAVQSLKTMNLPVVFAVGFGVILGVLVMSRFIQFLLTRYPLGTYLAIVGLLSGSVFAIIYRIEGKVGFTSLAFIIIGILVVTILNSQKTKATEH